MSTTSTATLVTMAHQRDEDGNSPARIGALMSGDQADRLASIIAAVQQAGLGGTPTPVPVEGLSFTPQQFEILDLMAQGCSNTELARATFKSVQTVKSHQGNIYRKLGVHTRVEAIIEAVRAGLLPSPAPAPRRARRPRAAATVAPEATVVEATPEA